MQKISFPFLNERLVPIALGTWVLGGCFFGGEEEQEVLNTLSLAYDRGIRIFDTAPLYGFGRTEETLGRALKKIGHRDQRLVATKFGLGWKDGSLYRDARKKT